MICSTPVISTDCISGPREILAPDTDINFQLQENIELAKNGILYPIDDVKSLSIAIMSILNDEEKQKEYIQNAREKTKDYALSIIMDKYKKVLMI